MLNIKVVADYLVAQWLKRTITIEFTLTSAITNKFKAISSYLLSSEILIFRRNE